MKLVAPPVVIKTESGSLHLVEARDGELWVTRVTDPDSSWSEAMRRDGESIRILAYGPLEIGAPWVLQLDLRGDGISTIRTTTPVVSVREAEASE